MHLGKKGAQGVHVCLTIDTIHGGPPVVVPLLPIDKGFYDDKKREETLREDLCGREDLVYELIPHQLVLRLVQPVHQFGVAGGPIVREHSTTFHWNLEMPDLTHLGGRLARARRTRAVPQTVGRTGKTYRNHPFMGISVKPARSSPAWLTYTGLSEVEKGEALDFPTLETDVS
jgi:hypothetical protein